MRVHVHVQVQLQVQVQVQVQVHGQVQVQVPYLDGPGVMVDGEVVAGFLLLGPVQLQELEDGPDFPEHAIAQDQLLPTGQCPASTSSSREAIRLTVMGQARGVQGGTAVTQVTEED